VLIDLVFSNGTFLTEVVGTYLVYGKLNLTSTTATLRLESFAHPFRVRDSAERVKNGLDHYTNRDMGFLMRELLKLRYRDSSSTFVIPSTFNLPDRIRIETAAFENSDGGDERGLSSYGRLPEKDTSNVWLNKGFVTRDMRFSNSVANLDDEYSGSLPLAEVGALLYHASDNRFYSWDPATEQSTELGTATADYNIHKIFYNSNNATIYIACWKDAVGGLTDRDHDFKIYSWDGATFLEVHSGTIAAVGDSYREGRVVSSNVTFGQNVDFASSGENVPIPFRQHVEIKNTMSVVFSYDGFGTDLLATLSRATAGENSVFVDQGYVSMGGVKPVGDDMSFRFTMGQSPFIVFAEDFSTQGAIIFVVNDSANADYDLIRYDIAGDSISTLISSWQVGGNVIEPLCGAYKSGDIIYVAAVFWNDASGAVNSTTYILEVNINTAGVTTRYVSSSDTYKYNTPLDMIFVNSKLYLSVLRRDRVGKHDMYKIHTHPGTSVQNSFDELGNNLFANQPIQFKPDSSDDLYFVEAVRMSLNLIDVSAGLIQSKDEGLSVVDGDVWNRALTVDVDTVTTDIVYGSSSQIPGEFLNSGEEAGKYILWKFDVFRTDRIEYANFKELNVWKVFELFAQIANHDYGFDERGDFFFFDKPASSVSADFTLSDDGDGDIAIKENGLEIEIDEDRVYNFLQIIPYVTVVKLPEYRYVALVRDENQKDFNYETSIQQRDTFKKRIILTCLTSGILTTRDIHFRFEVFDEKVNTVLRAAASATDTSIKINVIVDDIKEGDSAVLSNSTISENIVVTSDPDDDDKEERQLQIDNEDELGNGLDNAFSINDPIQITRLQTGASGGGQKNLEDDPFFGEFSGGDWVNGSKSNVEDFQDTSVFVFSKQSLRLEGTGASPTETRRYDSALFQVSSKYTIIVGVRGFAGSDTEPATNVTIAMSGVTQAISGWTNITSSFTEGIEWLRGTFITNASSSDIDLDMILTDDDGKAYIFGIFLLKGAQQEVDIISFGAVDKYVPIGMSNVWIKFVADLDEGQFKEGDTIEIDCPGKVLESREFFRAQYTDMDSRKRSGLLPYPDIDNRYIDRRRADDIARKLGSFSPNPLQFFKVRCDLDFRLKNVNTGQSRVSVINIKSRKMLPQSGDFTEKCKILDVQHNVMGEETVVSAVSFSEI